MKPIELQENGGTNNKNEYLLDKPIDLPFYKCIQLPEHLKWINVHGRSNEVQLMQEIEGLDMEIKRLKEVKALHKEYRRFSNMPIGVMSKPCLCCRGWSKKKHLCSHVYCDKPCRKQDQEPIGGGSASNQEKPPVA